ncbi:NAD-dependent epimerase/dehydratase family protein [Candidatus Pseudothioglobus sp. Uisw_016]|uniref:NAD-dependent epimerase/dehydratase family protein n=1 Tax=Candidatus Pseudothioglobus sp. Uisw_016 TaxID=3230995 RepID=UPI003A861268
MKILVTGGCGYKGHVLIPKLLNQGHHVTCFDIQWFGNFLKGHDNLTIIKGDIRNIEEIPLNGVECIIHLASIANDPCGDLNPKLTWEVSALATMQLADKAKRVGVKRFIYASSGSVYGIKDEEQVTEDLELEPISEYNKTKMVAERVLLSYQNDMVVQIIRPATVCGYSDRMRLDVSVNLLTMHALSKGKITVFGGDQVRPNIHIDDLTDLYIHLIDNPQITGVYNAGFENISILDIAEMVTKHLPVKIEVTASNDPRSYRVNSDKILATGFKPKKKVENAIIEIIEKFNSGLLKDEEKFYNLKWMQTNKLVG